MSSKLSTVTVAELRSAPGSFILLRADFPDLDTYYIWCGQHGWLPDSNLTKTLRHEFHSIEEAEIAGDDLITLPLQEKPSCSHN